MLLLTEIQNGPLAAELLPYVQEGNHTAIANIFNRKDITADGKVSAHDIQQYLMLMDLLLPIETSSADSCKVATRALTLFPTFDTSNPLIKAKLIQVLSGLVAETLIPDFTEDHKTVILSLALINISRAEQLGIYPVTHSDVALALRG